MVTAKIVGLQELSRVFKTLSFKEQRTQMNALLRAAAEPIRDSAEAHVRVGEKPPHIVDHIVVQVMTSVEETEVRGKRQLDDHEFAVAIGPSKDFIYGDFLERGTVKMSPKPFMRPAVDEGEGEAMRVLQHGVMPIVEGAVRAAGGRNL